MAHRSTENLRDSPCHRVAVVFIFSWTTFRINNIHRIAVDII